MIVSISVWDKVFPRYCSVIKNRDFNSFCALKESSGIAFGVICPIGAACAAGTDAAEGTAAEEVPAEAADVPAKRGVFCSSIPEILPSSSLDVYKRQR